MKRTLFERRAFFLLLFCVTNIMGIKADNINALKLWLVSGHNVIYKLDECPKVTFQGDEIIITTKSNTVSYKSKDAIKITHTYIDPTGIDNISTNETMISLTGNKLCVKNLTPHSSIKVYTLDGNLLIHANTDDKGQTTLLIPENPSKVLIVKTSITNFKIIK